MLQLHAYSDAPLCEGYSWTVSDEGQLAEVVAWLVLGEHLHARDILRELDRDIPSARTQFIDSRIAEFSTPPTSQEKRWHRDGWIFQMLSWIAMQLAHRLEGEAEVLMRAPQPRMADKGLDSLAIAVDAPEGPFLTIGEDKATQNARPTITDKVWPEFRNFEAQERDNEVVAEVGSLLEQISDLTKRRRVITGVLWDRPWHYRVAITITDDHDGPTGRATLFRGYDECIVGTPCARRRAETIVLVDLRQWMDQFSARLATALGDLRAVAGV